MSNPWKPVVAAQFVEIAAEERVLSPEADYVTVLKNAMEQLPAGDRLPVESSGDIPNRVHADISEWLLQLKVNAHDNPPEPEIVERPVIQVKEVTVTSWPKPMAVIECVPTSILIGEIARRTAGHVVKQWPETKRVEKLLPPGGEDGAKPPATVADVLGPTSRPIAPLAPNRVETALTLELVGFYVDQRERVEKEFRGALPAGLKLIAAHHKAKFTKLTGDVLIVDHNYVRRVREHNRAKRIIEVKGTSSAIREIRDLIAHYKNEEQP